MLQCLGLSSRPERHGDFAPLRKSLARSGGIAREYPLQCRFREFSPDRQPHTLSALNTVAPSQITALPTAIFHQAVTGTEHGANFLGQHRQGRTLGILRLRAHHSLGGEILSGASLRMTQLDGLFMLLLRW